MTHPTVHFSRGIPPVEAIPSARLAELTREVLSERGDLFQYAPIGRYLGDPALRGPLAKEHGADAGDILITTGSLQALDLVAAHLLRGRPGASILVEGPTYDRAVKIFERHGARVSSVPLEADGLDVDELARRLAVEQPAALYTIPDFQNPSGITLSGEKRRALVALAEQHGLTLIEDVPYRELRVHGEAQPGLRQLGGGARVITIGSLSKVLSPGLRVGYVISDADTAPALAGLAEGVTLSPVPLSQAVAARALESGLVQDNIGRIREILRPRHDAAVEVTRRLLGDALLAVPDGGYYLGVRLPIAPGTEAAFVDRARDAGLALIAGSGFYPAGESPADAVFLRLPFQSMTPAEFATGIERLAAVSR